MAQSRAIVSGVCGHEDSEPVEVSPDAIQQLTESWGKIQESGLLQVGAQLYTRYSWPAKTQLTVLSLTLHVACS